MSLERTAVEEARQVVKMYPIWKGSTIVDAFFYTDSLELPHQIFLEIHFGLPANARLIIRATPETWAALPNRLSEKLRAHSDVPEPGKTIKYEITSGTLMAIRDDESALPPWHRLPWMVMNP